VITGEQPITKPETEMVFGVTGSVHRFDHRSSDGHVVAIVQSDVWRELRAGSIPVDGDAETLGKRIGKRGMV
jgi:hypothetical protein